MVAILSSDSAFTYNTAEIIKNSSQIEIVHAFSDFDSLFSFDDESSPIIILLVHIPNDTKAFQRHLSKIKVGTEVALVYKTNPYKNLEIPSTNLSFNLLTENKLVLELPLAIACMRMGSKFVGSYFNIGFKKMRPYINSPSSFGITYREVDVVNWFLEGLTQDGIAAEMNLSPSTVKKHLDSVKQKLNLKHVKEIISCVKKYHWCVIISQVELFGFERMLN